jgi:putative hydroxymethylpyrimidine transport system permease protein
VKRCQRIVIILLGLLLAWQLIVTLCHLPAYILPGPWQTLYSAWVNTSLILPAFATTGLETLLGFILGSLLGCIAALTIAYFQPLRLWLLPLLIVSQALPTFAIAPLLVIWFGYGLLGKLVTTIIMLFFPVTSAFLDGLRQTPEAWLDLAQTMNAKKWRLLWHIQIPAALPALATGLRLAATIAPIGAIVGEWVGASQGLGFLLLNSNARMQIDLMFACLICIILLALTLYFSVDALLRFLIDWQ